MSDNFIRIATYNQPHEIAVIKAVLDDQEIAYYFKNENAIAADPLLSVATGGIDLMVKEEDAERATVLINSIEDVPLTDKKEEAEYDAWVEENRDKDEQRTKRTNTVLVIFVVLIIAAISLLFAIS